MSSAYPLFCRVKIQSELAYKPNKRESRAERLDRHESGHKSNRLNNFPISVSQIAEGMNNAGAALSSAGNNFDQSIALLTAANATIQNVSKSSTGLRTIAARIGKVDTELEELGETMTEAHYNELVQALTGKGVSLTDPVTGQLRSTYDVLRDIAAVWDTMGLNEQSALAEALAGNRQRNVFASIMQNFQDAENAMKAMQDSTGSFEESYGTYMDSISAHINQFKAAWQELATGFVDSDFLKDMIDLGTKLIGVVSGLTNGFKNWYNVLALIGFGKSVVQMFGGNWIGAAGTALATILMLISRARDAAKEASAATVTTYKDTKASAEENIKTIESLSERYEELRDKTILTKEEQEEYRSIVQQIVDLSPAVCEGYDAQGRAIVNYTDLIKDAVAAQQDYIDGARRVALANYDKNWGSYSDSALVANRTNFVDDGAYGELHYPRTFDNVRLTYDQLLAYGAVIKEMGVSGDSIKDVYENIDGIVRRLASYKSEDGSLMFSPSKIDELRAALFGLQDQYDAIIKAEASAKDNLAMWATEWGKDPIAIAKALENYDLDLLGGGDSQDQLNRWREYINSFSDEWDKLSEKWDSTIKDIKDGKLQFKDLSREILALENSTSDTDKAFAAYLRTLFTVKEATDSASNSTDNAVGRFGSLTSAIDAVSGRFSTLLQILNGDDLDADYGNMATILEKMQELLSEGKVGGRKMQALEDVFGLGEYDKNLDALQAWKDYMSQFFTEGSEGAERFSSLIRDLAASDGDFAKLASFDENNFFDFDETKISELASALSEATGFVWNENVLLPMLENLSTYSPDWHIGDVLSEEYNRFANKVDGLDVHVDLDTSGADAWLDTIHRTRVIFDVTGSGVTSERESKSNKSSGFAQFNASGTINAKAGISLLGDEYSSDGRPRPELVIGKNGAYLAGQNGPTVARLNAGDVVYPYSDTARILSGTDIQALRTFKDGKNTQDTLLSKSGGHLNFGGSSGSGSNGGGGGGGGSAAQEAEDTLEKIDWIVVALDRAQRAVKALEKVATSTFRNISTRLGATYGEMEQIRHEIDLQQQAAVRYQQEADSVGLSEDLAQLVRDGTIDIRAYDEETRNLISQYQEWYEKSLDCSEAVDGLHENLASLYTDNFSNVQKDYDNQLSLIEHGADMLESNLNALEAKGRVDTVTYYQKMQDIEKQNISVMEAELQDLRKHMDEAMESGEIEEGSEAWYEMQTSINGVEKALADANVNLLKYSKSIRDVEWGQFDAIRDRISDITKETNFLMELMGDSGLVDDQGGFTDAGTATMGLHAINFDTYMAQADAYAEEIRKLESDIANDPNNNDLIKRRRELLDLQRESISAANDEKQAMVNLVKEGIDAQLAAMKNLIDSYKESLDQAKDLHDYQKKITEKTSAIATLEKQIAAYSGDTSEENKSRLQKLTTELTKAQDDLAETEQERTLSEQKKMLDQLYEEYEDVLNSRLDDIDALITEMIEATNMNADAIKTTLETEAGKVGYALTDVAKLFQSGGAYDGLVSTYASGFDEKLNSINLFVKDITSAVTAMARAAGLELTDVKGYASGGLVDDTGYIKVHGSSAKPELVLDAEDTKNFLLMRDAFKSLQASGSRAFSGLSPAVPGLGSSGSNGSGVGNVTIQVDIDHVQDYNEFVQQMQRDPKVEKLIQAVSVDRMYGKGPLQKYHINFGN